MNLDRAAGILLHVTSLPGPRGIGDLGDPAHRFLEWLHRAGCTLWQFLPISPAGRGWSPYQSTSSFAGNPLLVNLDWLVEQGWLLRQEIQPWQESDRIEYEDISVVKSSALAVAAGRWRNKGRPGREAFESWCADNRAWLDDYAMFVALRDAHQGCQWTKWPIDLARREGAALARASADLAPAIEFHRLVQFWFYRQWSAVRESAGAHGIRLIGDLPIYPDHDSADVWAHPDLFELDPSGEPLFLAGVPPDYFSPTGQLWEAPVYRWDSHRKDGFRWWIDRLKHAASCFDALRLDHFRGLEGFWEVPAPAETAERGRWAEAPGLELLEAARAALGPLPIVAEDLGVITDDVIRLRDAFDLPGMRVLQFDLEEMAASVSTPRPYPEGCVAYTGTHDNDTSLGWYEASNEATRRATLRLIGGEEADVAESMVRWVWRTDAAWAIAPMQDVLSLGSQARMNVPGQREGNWRWRLKGGQLSESLAARVRDWSQAGGRLTASVGPALRHG